MLNLTKEDLEKLEKYPTYSQDDLGTEAEIVMKIHNPYGRGIWYVLEAEKADDGKDYICFGYVESPLSPEFSEYGYFSLMELAKVDIPIYARDVTTGEKIFLGNGNLEIDREFKEGTKMKEVLP